MSLSTLARGFLNPVPYGYKRDENGNLVLKGTPEPPIVVPPVVVVPEPISEPITEPIPEPKRLKDYINLQDPHDISKHTMIITTSRNWTFVGSSHYNKMYLQPYRIMRLCFELADKKYPEGDKAVLGDCGGMWFTHPQHNSKRGIFDPNYYTLLHNNTHYLFREHFFERIWVEEHYPFKTLRRVDDKLVAGLFRSQFMRAIHNKVPKEVATRLAYEFSDAFFEKHEGKTLVNLEKTYYFLTLLKKCCPRAVLMTNTAMHREFGLMIGEEAITQPGADFAKWNHDKHIHCDQGSEVDGEAIL